MSDQLTSGSVLVAVNELRRFTTGQLRERYAEVFGEPTNSRNRSYLFRKIAAELQDAGDAVRAPEEPRDQEPAPVVAPKPPRRRTGARDPRLPPPGTILERAHEGGVIRVTVLEDGFGYKGKTYRSLSAVAREATGTPWNGLVFFRLKPYAKRRGAT
jgi:hypothetical protein